MPSRGYWTFARDELRLRVPPTDIDRMEFWVKEFQAACRFYGSRTAGAK